MIDVDSVINYCKMELKEATREQRKELKEKYDRYLPGFFYAIEEDWGNFVLACSESTFNFLEYYLGFEYEREQIECMVKQNGEILVVYENTAERVEKLFERLVELEQA